MALQGTIDSFPLTDVLTLLGTSAKTGRLVVDGDRGSATLWVGAGRIVGGEVGGRELDDAATVVFELLRFGDGSFEFTAMDGDDLPEPTASGLAVDEGIVAAAELLERWEEIEAVVPSLRHRVVLVADPDRDEVVLDAASWAVVVTAGRAPMVGSIADELALDEFAACAAVARLVDDGLAEMAEPEVYLPATADPVDDAPLYDLEDRLDGYGAPRREDPVDDPFAADERPAATVAAEPSEPARPPVFPDRFPIDDLLGDGDADHVDPWAPRGADELDRPVVDDTDASSPFGDNGGFGDPEPVSEPASVAATSVWDDLVEAEERSASAPASEDETADEVLRQMSRLSPKAAEAIAAALSTVPPAPSTPAAPVDRDEEDGSGDGPVSFLGSF